MDLSELFTLANIILCLIIWILVLVQRKVISTFWKNAEKNKYYREIFLPLGPLGTGAIFGWLVAEYPYPEDFQGTAARIVFATVCGLLSAHIYKMVKGIVKEKLKETGRGTDISLFKGKVNIDLDK